MLAHVTVLAAYTISGHRTPLINANDEAGKLLLSSRVEEVRSHGLVRVNRASRFFIMKRNGLLQWKNDSSVTNQSHLVYATHVTSTRSHAPS